MSAMGPKADMANKRADDQKGPIPDGLLMASMARKADIFGLHTAS
jgi:hypothetical protein